MFTYPVLVNLYGECKYDIHGAYGVYNNSTYVLEFWLKLNLYWSTGMCLWQSTRLKAMCPRWTLLAAAFHLECEYLQCVCVSVCVYWSSVFLCMSITESRIKKGSIAKLLVHMSLTTGSWQCWACIPHPVKTLGETWKIQVYLSHPNKSSHRIFCLWSLGRLEVFCHFLSTWETRNSPFWIVESSSFSPSDKEALPEMINWLEQMAPPSPIGKFWGFPTRDEFVFFERKHLGNHEGVNDSL